MVGAPQCRSQCGVGEHDGVNVVFPLAHFRDLQQRRVIGKLAPRHFGLMGHIEGEQATLLIQRSAPEIAAELAADGVDFAFLTPA